MIAFSGLAIERIGYNGTVEELPEAAPTMPPNQTCPNCLQLIEDWHLEWYKTEVPSFYKGLAAIDCPLCGEAAGFQGGQIGPAPFGVPVVKRYVDKAADWAVLGAQYAGGTLQGYVSAPGPGRQYLSYWTTTEVRQADANEHAKKRGP